MLTALRHDTVICCHAEKGQINTADPREHSSNKAFVARDINKGHGIAARTFTVGKTKLYREPALFFFSKPVGIHPGQSTDQSGLTVIDMACRTDYIVFHLLNNPALTQKQP